MNRILFYMGNGSSEVYRVSTDGPRWVSFHDVLCLCFVEELDKNAQE